MAQNENELSPMMRHYNQIKEQYPNTIVFYRLGDFYELFFDDAIEISKILDLTLTSRSCGLKDKAPMCGVPFHSVDNYIAKLVKLGYKIAICEQLSDPVKGKQVERDVVRVITSGTVTSDNLIEEKLNNYLLCVYKGNDVIGIAYTDITTGDFFTCEYTQDIYNKLNDLILRINPAQIIGNYNSLEILENIPAKKLINVPKLEIYEDFNFIYSNAITKLKENFGNMCLNIFEINQLESSTKASGALISYLLETQKISLKQIRKIQKINYNDYMIIDATARRNLELTQTIRDNKRKGSLLSVIDCTKTAMGARTLRNWIEQPLKESKLINLRLDAVEELFSNLIFRENISQEITKMYDIERLTAKIGMQSIMPRDCQKLKESLLLVPNLKYSLINAKSKKLKQIFDDLKDVSNICNLLNVAIKEEPPMVLKDGGFIKRGYNQELDALNKIKEDGAKIILQLEAKEKESTKFDKLRIKFNNVYGYYIEIPKDLANQVPLNYIRKQTVGNFDRYFTEELKALENKILFAGEQIVKLENQLFLDLRKKLLEYIDDLQSISKAISDLDVLISFAEISVKNNYVKPIINNSINHIKIIEGRHPVVETFLKNGEFIANDTMLNDNTEKIMIITGPNMAGKSTYMRQVALITLMAHIGCFIPAKYAEISITDRIFTRVGASDDLAYGQSTFMVEMVEMANILHNATNNSLIILDEIGRGTSTFDGLSIAWSVVEYLSKNLKSKVLFATHYHELTELEGMLNGVKNYKISVKEYNNQIVFLRRILRGGANRSFGIEVASLAGLPEEIITRAKDISHKIEQQNFNLKLSNCEVTEDLQQQEKNQKGKQIVGILNDINVEKISPLDAFEILLDLIKKVK